MIKVEYFRGSGKGGQHRNKVETACRLVDTETGLTATCQDQRSKKQNYDSALATLMSRIQAAKQKDKKERDNAFRDTLFKGRVRTYDFTKGVVYDHLTGKQAALDKILDGELYLLNEMR